MTMLCTRSGIACVLAFSMTASAMPNTGPNADTNHQAHHPGQQGQVPPAIEGMRGMDMQAMCDMHKRMMSTTSSAEREAMMDEHMKAVSPEMRKQHLEQMTQRCKSY